MTKPYFLYNSLRYLIDIPLLILAYRTTAYLSVNEGSLLLEVRPYLFPFLSILAWYSAAQVSRLYTDLRTNKYAEEIVYILITILLFAILFSSFLFFFRNDIQLNNKFFIIYFPVLFGYISFTKYLLRKSLHSLIYSGKLLENIILVGSTPAAKDFYDTINLHKYYGYQCVGFLDDGDTKLNGCSYLGKIADLSQVLSNTEIDEVIIALPNSKHEQISATIEVCDFHAKRVRMIPDLYLYAASNISINTIGLLPVINLRSLPQDRLTNKLVKRIFDLIFSALFFLVIGWWFMPIIAVLIKITSKGPVFFKQERWGLNNKKINCYKFRTMYTGSSETDENGVFLQTTKFDRRITPLGKFLREWSIDEFPQFWNVLRGDMAVVGPRPHVTPLNISSIQHVDRYMLRHLVKPGITGLAQVNGCRGETSSPGAMQRRINYDLYYIHRWTFWMDCQIVLQTVINTIKGDQNAY